MVVEQHDQAPFDVVAHHALPAAGLVVHLRPRQADHVHEQAFREPVLAHHPGGRGGTGIGQLDAAIAKQAQEAVPLHPGHGLGRRSVRSARGARRCVRAWA